MKRNAYKALEAIDMDRWPENFDPFEVAIKNFTPKDLEALSRLLKSSDALVSRRGLYLFGELGLKAHSLLDDALWLVGHQDPMARNGLMNGILCYPEKLTVQQLQRILLIKDICHASRSPSNLVRSKVIVVLGAHDLDFLRGAIELIADAKQRALHVDAFRCAGEKIEDIQRAFDATLQLSGLNEVYALVGLIRAARRGLVSTAPLYEGDDIVSSSVATNIDRIISRKLRKTILWRGGKD